MLNRDASFNEYAPLICNHDHNPRQIHRTWCNPIKSQSMSETKRDSFGIESPLLFLETFYCRLSLSYVKSQRSMMLAYGARVRTADDDWFHNPPHTHRISFGFVWGFFVCGAIKAKLMPNYKSFVSRGWSVIISCSIPTKSAIDIRSFASEWSVIEASRGASLRWLRFEESNTRWLNCVKTIFIAKRCCVRDSPPIDTVYAHDWRNSWSSIIASGIEACKS